MNWRERIEEMYASREAQPGIASRAQFREPASLQEMESLEETLRVRLPAELRTLLLETNGVLELLQVDNGEWIENMWLIWPTTMIADDNLRWRQPSARDTWDRDFSRFLFFADAGSDGILFGHPVEGKDATASVSMWIPIGDEVTSIAPSLETFLDGWLRGTITA